MGYVIDFGHDKLDKRLYGIRFNGSNPGIRLYSANGLVFTPSNTTVAGRDDFIEIKTSPFAIKEVVTKYNSSTGKQEILAYEGDANWSSAISDSSHNRMIEFPKFYYRRPSQYEWNVSSYQHSGFRPSPMHYRNGVMHDKVYVSKYSANSSFLSQTNQSIITTSQQTNYGSDVTDYTLGRFRNEFRSRGLYNYDYATHCSLVMLMMIKYASMNVQSIIGVGPCDDDFTNKKNTGDSDSIKGKDGYKGANINSYASCKCFGIDNLYANTWTFTDGIYYNKGNNKIYINTNIENITDHPTISDTKSFQPINTSPANPSLSLNVSLHWISDSIVYDSTIDWAIFPTTVSSNWNDLDKKQDPKLLIGDGYFRFFGDGDNNAFYKVDMGSSRDNYYGAGCFSMLVTMNSECNKHESGRSIAIIE